VGTEALPAENHSAGIVLSDDLQSFFRIVKPPLFGIESRPVRLKSVLPFLRFITVLGLLPFAAAGQNFSFAAFGDMPYDAELAKKFEVLIDDVNRAKVRFAINVGDLRSGDESCSNEDLEVRLKRLARVAHPMVITPGDNDWTDCHRPAMGSFDPLERLSLLRAKLYPSARSLGRKTIPLTQQDGKFPENSRWSQSGIVFACLHVIGSNNNFGRNQANDAEFQARDAANREWLKQAFAEARKSSARGLVLVLHANMKFDSPLTDPGRSGYKAFLESLEDEMETFDRPILLIHGDHHTFRIDKPFFSRRTGARLVNLTRLELFGAKDIHWVRVDVDRESPELFVIHPVLVH
jgi:hypothetical protein